MIPVNKPNTGYARRNELESGIPVHTQLARFIVTKKKMPETTAVLATKYLCPFSRSFSQRRNLFRDIFLAIILSPSVFIQDYNPHCVLIVGVLICFGWGCLSQAEERDALFVGLEDFDGEAL